jgi:DNA-binding response OmpR family regulator
MARKKILIADYDKDSLEKFERLFTDLDMEVVTALDGEQDYTLYENEMPDIIILEAMLPKFHGFDLTQKIHKETQGSIPVVIVTGLYKGSQYKEEALRVFGAADYFEKPVDEEKLTESVLRLCKDEMDIDEDLPSTEDVIRILEDHLEKTKQNF